jgi:hypothetical protein
MALGGLASLFAGLPQGLADAAERRRRDEEMQMRQFAILQDLKNKQDQQSAEGAGYRALMGGAGDVQMPQLAGMPGGGQMQLPSVPDTGGAFPRQPMPSARPIAAPSMGGGMMAGGAIPARGTAERQQLKSLIYKDESGGRNVDQGVVPPGGGFNPSVGRVTGPSSASGYGQITDTTWRDTPTGRSSGVAHAKDAPFEVQDKAVDDLIDKRGVQPWAPYNAQLRKDLALPETQKAVGLTERQVAQSIPPMLQGNMNLRSLALAVERANPSLPDHVKMQVVERLQKLMGTQSQQEWEKFKFQVQQTEKGREFDIRERELRQNRQDTKEYRRESLNLRRDAQADKPGQFETFRDPSGNLHYLRKGESIPEGWQRDNKRMVGAQGMALQTFMDEFTKENGHPPGSEDIRQWQAANREATAEAGTVGNRAGAMEIAVNKAEAIVPLLKEKSREINRTEYPDINKIILAYEERTGDPKVVQYGEMINALRYTYASALSPTGQPRVADLQHFDEVMNKAWSIGQIDAALDQIVRTMNVERGAVKKTRDTVTGKKPAADGAATGAPKVLKFDKDGNPVP